MFVDMSLVVIRNKSKPQRTERQKTDEAIEMMKNAQSGKMRFIEPDEDKQLEKEPADKKPPRSFALLRALA